jgi:hypothetical protein
MHFRTDAQSSLIMQLTKLFHLNGDSHSGVNFNIQAESTTDEMLDNYAEVFLSMWPDASNDSPSRNSQRMGELDPTRDWIQARLEGGEKVYMVVGITTVVNPRVTVTISSGMSGDLRTSVPVDELCPRLPMQAASPLDFMITMTVGRAAGEGEAYTLDGKYVIAVQYCKLKIRKWTIGEKKKEVKEITWKWYARSMRTMTTIRPAENMVGISLGEPLDATGMLNPDEEQEQNEGERQDGDEDEDKDPVHTDLVEGIELVF